MSADILRRAAQALREEVVGTTGHPWTADGEEIYGSNENGLALVADSVHVDGRPEGEADAAYIALMHPPVALALAEWLEATAQIVEEWAATAGHSGDLTQTDEAAVNVARAILREES